MPRFVLSAVVAATLPLMVAVLAPTVASSDPLAGHRWRDRVLLVVADGKDDPKVRAQRAIFDAMGAEARGRDLVLVVVAGRSVEAAAVRQRFGLGAGFHALLIGKDGGAKLAGDAPLAADALFPLIDAMPMRQNEMRRGS